MDTDRSSPDAGPGFDTPLRRLYQVLFSHKALMLVVFGLVFGSLAGWAHLTPHKYRSEAKLLVQVGRENVTLDPTAVIGDQTMDPRTSWENELKSELEIVRNAELRRDVVRALGTDTMFQRGPGGGEKQGPGLVERLKDGLRSNLAWLLPPSGADLTEEDRAVLLLEQNLHVRLAPDSSVIKVGFDGPTPELSQRVVATLTEHFLEKHSEVHGTPGSLEFFTAETERLAKELRENEDHLLQLKNEAGLSSIENQRTASLARLGKLYETLVVAEADAESAEAKVRALEAAMVEGEWPDTIVLQETTALVKPGAEALRQQIDLLKLQEKATLQDYGPSSRRVEAIRDQVRLAEELLAQIAPPGVTDRVEGPNPALGNLQLTLMNERALATSLRARTDTLGEQLESLRAETENFNDLELEIQRAQRKIEDLETRYKRQKSNLEQVRIDQALQDQKISSVAVLQEATLPLKSERLGNKIVLLLALMLGVVAAGASAFVAEFADLSLRTPDETRARIGLPVLGAVERSWRLRRGTAISSDPVDEFVDLEDRILGELGSDFVLAVTAARPGEGVSTVAAHVANRLAQRITDGAVLLVDASMASPSAHRQLEGKATPGLVDQLFNGAVDVRQSTENDKLDFLPAGDLRSGLPSIRSPHGRACAMFERLVQDSDGLLENWRSRYRHVVFDLPAVGELPLVPRLASRCDATLLVVAANTHRWQVIKNAKDELEARETRILGTVLNKRRYPIPGWLYRTL